MLGPGRPAKGPEVFEVRELTQEEVLGSKRRAIPSVKRFRDSHHLVARLFALGLRPGEVAERSGYTLNRVSILYADPAFQALVENYRKTEKEAHAQARDEYYELVSKGRVMAARMMIDQLETKDEAGEEVPLRTLLSIQDSFADRTGYPKRTVATTYNLDLAARLDLAIDRSKVKVLDLVPEDATPSSPESARRRA